MDDMSEFQLFHAYNRLVREHLANPLICPMCAMTLVTGLGKDDNLVLLCYACQTSTVPGENTLARVRAAVSEWIL